MQKCQTKVGLFWYWVFGFFRGRLSQLNFLWGSFLGLSKIFCNHWIKETQKWKITYSGFVNLQWRNCEKLWNVKFRRICRNSRAKNICVFLKVTTRQKICCFFSNKSAYQKKIRLAAAQMSSPPPKSEYLVRDKHQFWGGIVPPQGQIWTPFWGGTTGRPPPCPPPTGGGHKALGYAIVTHLVGRSTHWKFITLQIVLFPILPSCYFRPPLRNFGSIGVGWGLRAILDLRGKIQKLFQLRLKLWLWRTPEGCTCGSPSGG